MKEYKFIWSDHSLTVEVFNQEDIEKEVRTAVMIAANDINRKHRKQNKSCFHCLKKRILTKKDYEEMKENEVEDLITKADQESIEIDVSDINGTINVSSNSLREDDGDVNVVYRWFKRSVNIFQKSQFLYHSKTF